MRAVAILLLLCLGCLLGLRALAVVQDDRDFMLGLSLHASHWQDEQLLSSAGAHSYRTDLFWNQVETSAGVFELPTKFLRLRALSGETDKSLLWILCYGNRLYTDGFPDTQAEVDRYVDYAQFAVRQFPGEGVHFEIWNEWDWGFGGPSPGHVRGDPAEYVHFVERVSEGIRKVSPNEQLLVGAVSRWGLSNDWLEQALEAGLLEIVDQLSIHPYHYGTDDQERLPEVGLLGLIRSVKDLCIRHGAPNTPLHVTELGLPTFSGPLGSSEDWQARYLARATILLWAEPQVKSLYWYAFQDDGRQINDHRDHFGIVRVDGTPKPAFFVFKDLAQLMRRHPRIERVSRSVFPEDLWAFKVPNANGSNILLLWTQSTDRSYVITLNRTSEGLPSVFARELGQKEAIHRRPAQGRKGAKVTVTVSDMPMVLSGVPDMDSISFDVQQVR